MNSDKEKYLPVNSSNIDMAALWQESMADEDFRFEIKAQNVAVDLVRAISNLGLTQAQLANKLGWKPSRVSRVLHNAPNVTLRTLFDIATALNLEFDIIYRATTQRKAPQPWEAQSVLMDTLSICREIDSLHASAHANLASSEAILSTARQLNHRGWNAAKNRVTTKPVALPEAA